MILEHQQTMLSVATVVPVAMVQLIVASTTLLELMMLSKNKAILCREDSNCHKHAEWALASVEVFVAFQAAMVVSVEVVAMAEATAEVMVVSVEAVAMAEAVAAMVKAMEALEASAVAVADAGLRHL